MVDNLIKCCMNCKYCRLDGIKSFCRKQKHIIFNLKKDLDCIYFEAGWLNKLFPWIPDNTPTKLSGGCVPTMPSRRPRYPKKHG